MAEREDLEELKDIANVLKSALEGAVASADRMNRSFSGSKNDLINMNDLFEKLVESSDDLPTNIAEGKDLQKAMISDARLFNKVQSETLKLFDRINEEGWQEMLRYLEHTTKKQGVALEQTAEYAEALRDRERFEEKNLSLIKRQFDIMQKQAEARRLDSLALGNITDAMNDLGAKIRNPDAAFSSMLKNAGALPVGIFEAAKGSKNLGETMKKLIVPAMEKMKGYAKILFSASGLLVAGVALATAAFVGLYALVKNFWSFMDSKVMPAQAAFNREIGATSEGAKQLKSDVISTGVQFELLGKSFQEGVQFANDFVTGLGSVSEATKEAQQLGKELTLVVGLTAEESGKLVGQFRRQGQSLKDVRNMFAFAEDAARSYGLPVNETLRDMGKFPNILARFGTTNRMEFAKSAAKARSYGLDIGRVNDAFGEQLDTFEGSSDAAAKLNAMFGTTVNSYELMLETDPTKRMEMLRTQLERQGKSWEKLNVFEKNVIKSTMNIDDETASLVLSSKKERAELEKKAAEKKKQIDLDTKWNKSLGQIKETLIAWGPLLDKLMRSITRVLAKLFGFKSAEGGITDTAKAVENFINNLDTWINTKFFDSPGGKLLAKLFGVPIPEKKYSNWKEALADGHLETYLLQMKDQNFNEAWDNVLREKLKTIDTPQAKKMLAEMDAKSVNDALITKTGEVVKFHPQDNIIATKADIPKTGLGKSGGSEDIDKIVRSIVSSMKSEVKVEIMDINLDGKKIGEAQVKISRR